ncbi:MAG: threonine--tRNA ligase [Candidatus Dojkabacteria bacterium]
MDQKQSEEQLIETMRHSFAHVLAQAVLRRYPDAKLGIGPAVEDGFYYDFELPEEVSTSILPEIEAEMVNIIDEGLPFKQILIPREQAFDTLHHLGQIFKTELLQQVPDDDISFYKTGEEFIDLCRGPHVTDTSQLQIFKLTDIGKTNWLGDKSRPTMVRIHGVAFAAKKELEQYLDQQKELQKRDHKRLGKEIGIFLFDKEISDTLPVLLSRGKTLKENIKSYVHKLVSQNGYQFVETPELAKQSLFTASGQLNYQEGKLLPVMQAYGDDYRLRNENFGEIIQIFKSKKRSYKELPLKLSEFAVNYTNTPISALDGLISTRRSSSDSHFVFTTKDSLVEEVGSVIKMMTDLSKAFGFKDYRFEMVVPYSDQRESYMGTEQDWKEGIWYLEKALSELKIVARTIDGDTSYFGPQIQIIVKDIFKREWSLSDLTLDVILPKLLNLKYITHKSEDETPAIIHHHLLGSIERFIGLMIEQNGGAFPTWLAPTQVKIIPISQKFNIEAKSLLVKLIDLGIRAELDIRDETMQSKIRDAQIEKIPYMLIMGEKEVKTNSISVRPRSGNDLGLMRLEEFLHRLSEEITTKSN